MCLRAGWRIQSEYCAVSERGGNPLIVSDQDCDVVSYSLGDWLVSYHGNERLRTRCCLHRVWHYSWPGVELASWSRIAEEPTLWGQGVLNNLLPTLRSLLVCCGALQKQWARWFVLRSKETHIVEYLLCARPCLGCFIDKWHMPMKSHLKRLQEIWSHYKRIASSLSSGSCVKVPGFYTVKVNHRKISVDTQRTWKFQFTCLGMVIFFLSLRHPMLGTEPS